MREEILKRFFLGEVGVDALVADVNGSMIEGRDTTGHVIEDFEQAEEGFEVKPEHLIFICDAVLSGRLEAKYLQVVGFCLVGSDSFDFDTGTPEGALVADTAIDWASPGANYPLTIENVRKFRERLGSGEDTLSAKGAG